MSMGCCTLVAGGRACGVVHRISRLLLRARDGRTPSTAALQPLHSPLRRPLCNALPTYGIGSPRCARYVAAAAAHDPAKEAPCSASSPVPLAERDGKAIATAAQVLEWRLWARAHAAGMGSRYDASDGLPSLDSLRTEVDWIVEDAVAGVRDDDGQSGSGGAWCGVGQLSGGLGLPHGCQVLLREDLEGLRRMWTARMRDRIPVQYLTGSCHWRDLVLVVTPAVLIPRPETEVMVDFVAEALNTRPALANAPWADLGTGSGALAISVAAEIAKMKRHGASAWIDGDGGALVHAVVRRCRLTLSNPS